MSWWEKGLHVACSDGMLRRAVFLAPLVALSVTSVACSQSSVDDRAAAEEGEITSNDAKPVELKFKGQVIARADDTPRKAIAAQLMYLQGALTNDIRGNGQTGMPTLANVREEVAGDKKTISYEVALAAAWPNGLTPPETYAIVVPKDVTALDAFNAKYDGRCGHNEYGQETFWHDWNPKASGCAIDDADVVKATAAVAPHPQATEGKYPEYDQIWADDALDIVAVFGIISSNTPSDEGARTREQLLAEVSSSVTGAQRSETTTVGAIADSTVTGKITVDGREKRVTIHGLLVQEASSAGSAFYTRYNELTKAADLVIYEGHSGLGKNINALARNTGATAGKYQLVYLYGCQTLAYLEPVMHENRIALNGAERDPEGTKYLDIIANALPAYGDSGRSTIDLYRSVLRPGAAPKNFNQLIDPISTGGLVVVFGEHDNTYQPSR
jgi:hypothetical protein